MHSAPLLDDETTATIRNVLREAGAGRIAQACQIGHEGLASGGEPAALNALLGSLYLRRGDLDKGVDHLRAAGKLRPTDPVVAFNLASALGQLGDYRGALSTLEQADIADDRTVRVARLRGFLLQSLEDFPGAVAAYETVVAAVPDDWESWNNLGNARRGVEDYPGAVDALRRAVELNAQSAPTRLNFAMALEFAGKADQAEAEYRSMALDFSDDAKPLRALFTMLKRLFREEDAAEALEQAVERAPTDLELVLGLASDRLNRHRHAAAEQSYRQAIAIDPGNTLGHLGLATVFDQTNRTDELSALVGEAERANVSPAGQYFVQAFDHRRAKRYEAGLEALRHVPNELETARRQQLLGQLLEGVGRYDDAFVSFEQMNAITRDDPSEAAERAGHYRQQVRSQRDTLNREWRETWQSVDVDQRPSPVFLVGFPRSGTTLLDTILMGHPDTEVLEEEPPLHHALTALGGFDAIPRASEDDVRKARDRYFESARSLTAMAPGKLLIDKNPLAMNQVPIIRRLFPDARIILALRHPCDVVLSCFVTNFRPNNSMCNFLHLDTAAELYDLSFSYFEKARETLSPRVHTIRYENIVEDRDRELRPLLEFLGLPWDDRLLDHQSTARGRAHIKTASYAQVVEPIYKRSAGRWRNYRTQLAPILSVLAPWCERFGYEL